MLRRTMRLVGALGLTLAIVAIVFLLGMRTKSPRVLDTVRRVNRAVFNPRQMESAGTPGAYASVIRHRGRTTGTPYETPIGAVPTEEGFVVALPYGTRSDWLKNLLAGGSAGLVHEGRTYLVDQPEVIPLEVAKEHFPLKEQRSMRLFGVDQCLRVRRVEVTDAA